MVHTLETTLRVLSSAKEPFYNSGIPKPDVSQSMSKPKFASPSPSWPPSLQPILHQDQGQTLHLPRLLCLHGGGTNARIFAAQCRTVRASLSSHFRLVFAEAPFLWSRPGPDVLSVYADWGPFRGWLGPLPGDKEEEEESAAGLTHAEAARRIDACLDAAVAEDKALGATGPVVGLIGFSQGAKVAASLLLREQLRMRRGPTTTSGYRLKFAVLMAGRAPLVALSPGFGMDAPANALLGVPFEGGELLRLPTIHVHGTKDAGLEFHRELMHDWCEEGTTRLMEWDGDHRLPFKTKDVAALVELLLEVASQIGVLRK